MTVESVATNLTVVVHRDNAVFGSVSAFCYAQSLKNGATQNEDFSFEPQVMIQFHLAKLIFLVCSFFSLKLHQLCCTCICAVSIFWP